MCFQKTFTEKEWNTKKQNGRFALSGAILYEKGDILYQKITSKPSIPHFFVVNTLVQTFLTWSHINMQGAVQL